MNLDSFSIFFFFNDTATTEIYTLSLHDALPILHSDDIYIYNGLKYDGDALITNKRRIAIGVFTADCVPVLIYDKKNLVVAAIHSGWKGTLNCIVSKTIDTMINRYNSNIKDLEIYIGPHNMMCCYEVSEELIHTFKSSNIYKEAKIDRKSVV